MGLFLILAQLQAAAFIVCAIILRLNLPRSVLAVVDKNSKRLDGSRSRRRKRIEMAALRHSMRRVHVGLLFLFLATTMIGLMTANLELRTPRLDADASSPGLPTNHWQSTRETPWPVILLYVVSSFMVAPQMISGLYRSAIRRYQNESNVRFNQYWRDDWMNMKITESEQEYAAQDGLTESQAH